MKKQIFLVIVLCWTVAQMPAQVAFRHVTTAANVSGHITSLDHPQLNGNPNAMLFVLPNYNLNGAEAAGQNYQQNAGVWYNGSRWTIFNQDTKEPMPLNMTFNVLIAPAGNPNCFTFTVTEASKTNFVNGAAIDHPATNGKTDAMILLTQNWAGVYLDASQVTEYWRGKWCIFNNGYDDYYNGKTKDMRWQMPVGARFNVMVIENKKVPGFPNAQVFQHTAKKGNTYKDGPITYLEPANLVGKKEVMLFATAYWGHLDSDRTGPHQAGGPYNEGPLVAWYDHPDDQWKHGKDMYWSLYNSNGRPMPEGAKMHVVVLFPDSFPSPENCCAHLFAPNATKRDTATFTIQNLFADGPETIFVEVIGGYVIFQSDIVIGRERDYFKRVNGKLVPIKKRAKTKSKKDAGTPLIGLIWPNGVIPFEIAANHPLAANINSAIATFNNTTDLCMIPRTNETDFVRFTNDNSVQNGGCWSMLGRQTGIQLINIGNGCGSERTILHEILHAAGVFHEQCRPDRDNYVRINWENIIPHQRHNFAKVSRLYSACSYDFGSIMHYDQSAFSANGQPTITPVVPAPDGVQIGRQNRLSECDIRGLRNLYPNAAGCRNAPPSTWILTIFSQPNSRGGSKGFNAGTDTPQVPAVITKNPFSIDIMPGWVAILTLDCDAEIPETRTIFRDEPNITLPSEICRIELVPIADQLVLNIPDFGRRCPTRHTRGDQEFNGNGPALYCSALVFPNHMDNTINLMVSFVAAEIGGDQSFVADEWNSVLLNVPSEMRVLAIDRPASTTVGDISPNGLIGGFRSRPAGPEVFFCNEGQIHLSGQDFQLRGDLVRDMIIVGDTGHLDINTGNCGCDTGIRNILFNPVRVYLGRR